MPVSYSPWLVLLSVALAIQGSYVGLTFAIQAAGAEGARQRALLAGAAITLALGVWTMHFVGMLAERVPFPVDYLVLPTLLSFLVCVIVIGAGILAASAGPPTLPRIGAAAVFMGLGVVAMHYIGMETLRACAEMVNSAPLVLAAAALAVAASGLALWLALGGASHSLPVSAIVLGLAISGMHYTATSGLSLYPRPAPAIAPALSPDLLAVIVAVVAFMVSGGFLLLLVPERNERPERVSAESPPIPANGAAEPVVEAVGSFSPLGGAGGPPRRAASHIPIERNGLTSYLPASSIVAIRADAHYTHVFDGTASHFCSLSIGEVEQRLDPRLFARVHRSHIVNIARVDGARFNGDSGVIELSGQERYSVPVSRGRIGQIKARLSGLERAAQ
ncbi:MAG: MHYT domain-containing protein [Roseiarcus sp.]|uniref:MHYT domain-containing protein n=1 Tax=Roseiarcus sp. TaxID=1969460 RepID=UPI003C36660E